MSVGFPELVLILAMVFLMLVPLALVVWNVIDVAQRPESQFAAAGQNRTLWLALPIVLTFVGVGWIVSLIYFLAIRPKVIRATP